MKKKPCNHTWKYFTEFVPTSKGIVMTSVDWCPKCGEKKTPLTENKTAVK